MLFNNYAMQALIIKSAWRKMMNEWKIDVAVLCIFFARPDQFKQVFEQVKKARPSKLLLWQDGPRENRPDDLENIKKCREIAEDIDWDCEVYKNYHDKNMGCDPSTFYADKWAFSIVDKCIILEDDQVPSQSFFYYCKELLDKYEFDTRISHINGHNFIKGFEKYPYDYLFASSGTGAWASWKRVADMWDEKYTFLEQNEEIQNFINLKGKYAKKLIDVASKHKKCGFPFWESILGMNAELNSMLAIIPKINMVQNIGVTANATHALSDIKCMPKSIRIIFESKANEIELPLKHPHFVCLNQEYENKKRKLLFPNIFVRWYRNFEMLCNLIVHGKFSIIWNKFVKKIKRH